MRKWWVDFWDKFWNDPAFFTATMRALIGSAGIGLAALAQQLSAVLSQGAKAVVVIRVVGAVFVFVAFIMRAGDKNETDDELRERLTKLGVAVPPASPPAEPPSP